MTDASALPTGIVALLSIGDIRRLDFSLDAIADQAGSWPSANGYALNSCLACVLAGTEYLVPVRDPPHRPLLREETWKSLRPQQYARALTSSSIHVAKNAAFAYLRAAGARLPFS
jgi:hypothetical protein